MVNCHSLPLEIKNRQIRKPEIHKEWGMLAADGRIRVGVIGLGIGRWHVESYLAIPEAKVVALCDIDQNRLRTAATRYGVAKIYTDYEELCQSGSVDAVSICVPNHKHAPVAVCALENGKNVLCEKPLSVSPEQGRIILEAANKHPDLKAMMAMKFRFNKDSIYVKNMVENGDLGGVYYGFSTYLRQLGGIPKMGTWFTKKKLSGGGPLIDNGVHFLDLIWWLMGCPNPVEAFGITHAKFGPYGKGAKGWTGEPSPDVFDVEDLALGTIKFENDASVMLDNAWATFVDKDVIGMRLCGTKGGATLWPFRICYEESGEIISKTPDLTNVQAGNQFKHFIDCILNNKQPISTIEQGVTVLNMLDAIYRSAEKGESVAV
jgi:predicted dehydrogenase